MKDVGTLAVVVPSFLHDLFGEDVDPIDATVELSFAALGKE